MLQYAKYINNTNSGLTGNSIHKPILVTGSHRSGSTWVGRMIAQSPSVGYIHEPFNIGLPPGIGIVSTKFNYWFTYLCSENGTEHYHTIEKIINFQDDFMGEVLTTKNFQQLRDVSNKYRQLIRYRNNKVRPLVKDPIALFAAEWLASNFNMDVVILIRHPGAFIGSLKVKNWKFPFAHFLKQPLLMKNLLYPFKSEIEYYAQVEQDIVDQGTLLWRIIHYLILQYKDKHQDWLFIRHEDLSVNPLDEFQHLFNHLNLDFSESVKQAVVEHSIAKNIDSILGKKNNLLKRNSKSNIRSWHQRLTKEEITRIKSKVADISPFFYSNEEWD